jgi:hypothetical protein
MKRMAELRAVARVRVLPRDESVRRDIRHMPGGIAFPAEGSVEWPLDQFTKRRLIDGTVIRESEEAMKARQEERDRHQAGRHTRTPQHGSSSS